MGRSARGATGARNAGRPVWRPQGDVRVWALRVPVVSWTSLDLSALDREERRRMDAFVRDADRLRYGFAHAALRTILSGLTGTAPGALRFVRASCPGCGGPHGRPVLTIPAPEFSLSHSRDMVLVAASSDPIGVDVEPTPEPGVVEDLARILHPAERGEIEAAPPEGRPAVFARLWARKEAYLKGLGTGLGRGASVDDVRGDLPGWRLTDLPVGTGYAAALAVRSPVPRPVRLHRTLPV
ncbi:4'-phosphopantetheinyl transferase superfamily protein [Streptomyces sp. NK15101]|uniref:4'-phosphopantetheinyl transferase family protein n=1 Tax=Streptomyces sp. NK15101 TaxID=2873261 RepID=UPI001CEC71B7|nr:4'-phosphopantetheinyl transferase superfamily protein [Streptomyces sp. NK15101]